MTLRLKTNAHKYPGPEWGSNRYAGRNEPHRLPTPTATFRRARAAADGSKRSVNSWFLCLVEQDLYQVDAHRLPMPPTIPEVAEVEPSTLRVRPVANDVIEVAGHGVRTALRLPVNAAVPPARLLLDQVV